MLRLRELRLQKGLTMKDMAAQLQIAYTTYVGYEKGDREPDSERLLSLAQYFGVTCDYLMGRTEDPHKIYQAPTIGTLSQKELKLINLARRMDDSQLSLLIKIADAIIQK